MSSSAFLHPIRLGFPETAVAVGFLSDFRFSLPLSPNQVAKFGISSLGNACCLRSAAKVMRAFEDDDVIHAEDKVAGRDLPVSE